MAPSAPAQIERETIPDGVGRVTLFLAAVRVELTTGLVFRVGWMDQGYWIPGVVL